MRKLTRFDFALLALILCGVGYSLYRVDVVLDYPWNWPALLQFILRDDPSGGFTFGPLSHGLFFTLRLSFWATILALVLGTVMGLTRISPRLFRRMIGISYVGTVRNLPPLILIFIVYYFFSDQIFTVFGLETILNSLSPDALAFVTTVTAPQSSFNAFAAGVATLGFYEGAYISEILRGGIESIERGQWEAVHTLGLTRQQGLRHVILPQALRRTLPQLAGQFISTIKDSAIVSIISIPELTFQGLELMASTYLTFEIWITVTLLYLILCLSCSLAVASMEKRLRVSGDFHRPSAF